MQLVFGFEFVLRSPHPLSRPRLVDHAMALAALAVVNTCACGATSQEPLL